MDLGLKDKVVFVAAASKGLGRAIAEEFAREGARLVICSRDGDAIATAAKEIAKATGSAHVTGVTADLSKKEDCERFISKGLEAHGRMDVLLVNAGGPPPGRFEDLDESKWDLAYQLTLQSAVRLTRLALPELKKTKGNIVFSTSTSVRQPTQYLNLILSNSLRGAVHGMLKTLSKDFAQYGIRVNAIQPGRIDTERVRQLDEIGAKAQGKTPDEIRKGYETGVIPLGRYGEPREFAAAAVFLASERASYITGVSLQVDGGMLQAMF